MANWWEEHELKKTNGQARTTTMYHTKKTHEQLFPDVAQDKIDIPVIPLDNTQARILGALTDERYISENLSKYGTGKNKANDLPTRGKRAL